MGRALKMWGVLAGSLQPALSGLQMRTSLGKIPTCSLRATSCRKRRVCSDRSACTSHRQDIRANVVDITYTA